MTRTNDCMDLILKHLNYGKVYHLVWIMEGLSMFVPLNMKILMKITDYYSIYVYNYDSWKFDEILLMGFMFEET